MWGMTVELEQVSEFLAGAAPFAQLPEKRLQRLVSHMQMHYVRNGEKIVGLGEPNDFCYVIRSGAVDVLDSDGNLLDRREAGRSFGYSTILGENSSRFEMVAVEDTLLLTIPREQFQELAEEFPDLRRYYSSTTKRMKSAAAQLRNTQSSEILRTPLRNFMIKNPVTIDSGATLQEAAIKMRERNVSSLLITDPSGVKPLGIITDRDMRNKVVAGALDVGLPVRDVMTPDLLYLPSDSQAFEAMIMMTEKGIHHLPVVDEGNLVGIITSPDIMRLLRNDPIYITADLSRKSSPEDLKKVYASAEEVALRFIDRGASPEDVAGLLSVSADALARRLLVLGEEKFGAPPVPYAFVVVGSQGRRGMGLASDQDNCLVLDDSYSEAEHGEYFAQLSEYVCRGLDAAGQVLCPGDMMAMNPEWRMTTSQWINTFRQWITAPEPDALLHAQTFFDFRAIHGAEALANQVHQSACDTARGAGRMHAHLATLAARREPPLGFFRGFVVDRKGEYANTLDIKKGGTAAVVQMARLYALKSGVTAVGTRQRLLLSAGKGTVSEKGAHDLVDAFDFLNVIGLRNQAVQMRAGQKPTYHIDPTTLGKMDRENLRDAFQIIKSMQNALGNKFPVNAM